MAQSSGFHHFESVARAHRRERLVRLRPGDDPAEHLLCVRAIARRRGAAARSQKFAAALHRLDRQQGSRRRHRRLSAEAPGARLSRVGVRPAQGDRCGAAGGISRLPRFRASYGCAASFPMPRSRSNIRSTTSYGCMRCGKVLAAAWSKAASPAAASSARRSRNSPNCATTMFISTAIRPSSWRCSNVWSPPTHRSVPIAAIPIANCCAARSSRVS